MGCFVNIIINKYLNYISILRRQEKKNILKIVLSHLDIMKRSKKKIFKNEKNDK